MAIIQFCTHIFIILFLFILDSSVFASSFLGSINVSFIYLYIVYLSFFFSTIKAVFLLLFAGMLVQSTAPLPPFIFIIPYLLTLISIKQLISRSISITQPSITVLTGIHVLLFSIYLFTMLHLRNKDQSAFLDYIKMVPWTILIYCLLQPILFLPLSMVDEFFHKKIQDKYSKDEFDFKISWWR